jgi:hypothetical protein
MDWLATKIEYYLPVFIPLFLTAISVLAGIVTKRIGFTLGSLLKIHTDVVLGLFSFVIWGLVQYQQTGHVRLNADYDLKFVRVVLLLFADIFLLIAGLIALNVDWATVTVPGWKGFSDRPENKANGALLTISLIAVFAPILLAAKVAPADRKVNYAVAVPYVDHSLTQHLGTSRWGERKLCYISVQPAFTPDSAVAQALDALRVHGFVYQMYTDRSAPAEVDVYRAQIVVARQTAPRPSIEE